MKKRLIQYMTRPFILTLSRPSFIIVLLVIGWLLTCARLLHSYWDATAITFPDIDDAMRLAQLQDFLNGQGWFDLHQARLTPPQGYDTHWSRLIDAGLAGFYFLFRTVADDGMAERLMRALWPLLWILPAIIGASSVAWRMAGVQAAMITLLLILAGGSAYQQFLPGTIDHHNVQIGLIVLVVAATVWSDRTLWCASAAGFLTAFSIAIGLETLPYLAVCGSAFALRFVCSADAARSLRHYALSLMIGLIVLFFATIGPVRWLNVQCDAFAFNLIAAIAPAAAALVIGSFVAASGIWPRAIIVVLAAMIVLAMVVAIEPRCVLGPYALIDQRVWSLWLSSVFENQPLTQAVRSSPARVMPMLAFPVMSLGALIVLMRRKAARSDFAVLVLGAVFLTAWLTVYIAVRAIPYVIWLGFPVVAAAAVAIFQAAQSSRPWGQLTLALLLSPFVLGSAVSVVLPANAFAVASGSGEMSRNCRLSDNVRTLAALPPGLVATGVFHGAHILALTSHSVLAAPFHRNLDGALAVHRILAARPDDAREAARSAGVTYIALCGPRPPDGLSEAERKQGLWAHLDAGAVPDWLDPVTSTIGRSFTVYRVLP